MQTINKKRTKIRNELLKELGEPVRQHGCPEQKRDIRVFHPECLYSNKTTGVVVESRYIWWVNHPNDKIEYGEIIHHNNGNRQDNRIENLTKIPWSGHTKLHRDMKNGTFIKNVTGL